MSPRVVISEFRVREISGIQGSVRDPGSRLSGFALGRDDT
jgi:hypothetical protein